MKTDIIDEVTDSVEPLLADVISGFISYPEELKVESARMGGSLQFNIDGNPDDLPKIMGRSATNLAALRALFGAMVNPFGCELRFNIADRQHERSAGANQAGFVSNPDWPREKFVGLLSDVLHVLCETPPEITEKIVKPRTLRFGAKTISSGPEESMFNIKPATADLPVFTANVETAIELIFRAIGQQQGRRITINFTNAQQAVPQ